MIEDTDRYRPRLMGLAYRMLSDRAEAEDVVQDVLLRFHRQGNDAASPLGWLLTATARASIDRLRALEVQRRRYTGPWLPEPVVGDPSPLAASELADDLSVAFLLMLERLSPEERAAFLLHTAFDREHAEIARALGKSEVAIRQMVHRARERLRDGRPRGRVDPERARAILERLMAAWAARDEAALRELLTADVTYTSDGGGRIKAARRVIHGPPRVIRLLLALTAKYLDIERIRSELVGGEPGFLTEREGRVFSAVALELDGDRIRAFYAVLNPEKLGTVPPPAAA